MEVITEDTRFPDLPFRSTLLGGAGNPLRRVPSPNPEMLWNDIPALGRGCLRVFGWPQSANLPNSAVLGWVDRGLEPIETGELL